MAKKEKKQYSYTYLVTLTQHELVSHDEATLDHELENGRKVIEVVLGQSAKEHGVGVDIEVESLGYDDDEASR